MKAERLFSAIGGADPRLLMRSERAGRASRALWKWGSAGAACLAAMLALMLLLDKPAPVVAPPSQEDPPAPQQILQLSGGEVGELHLLQINYGPQTTPAPDFVIYVNQEAYTVSETEGAYVIRPIHTLPEGEFPPCDLTVTYRADRSLEAAAAEAAEMLRERYAQVSDPVETPQGLRLTAGDGTAWNAAQAEVTCVADRQGGAYLLTARYFTEAAEGHGVRFRDMAETFQVASGDPDVAVPAWMSQLKETADTLMGAIFANRLEDAAPLLSEQGAAEGYGADVSADVSIAAVDYTVDDDQFPASAVVSVKHRISTEESYNYLTMELSYVNGGWLLDWAGLEK